MDIDLDRLRDLMTRYELKLSSIVYYEFLVGVYRSGESRLKAVLDKYFDVISVTSEVADMAAQIQASLLREGKPIDHRDLFIASTAITEGTSLWTNNIRHFERLMKSGLKLYQPK